LIKNKGKKAVIHSKTCLVTWAILIVVVAVCEVVVVGLAIVVSGLVSGMTAGDVFSSELEVTEISTSDVSSGVEFSFLGVVSLSSGGSVSAATSACWAAVMVALSFY